MSRSTIKRIQDTLESLTASVASLVAKDISQDKAINSTKAMLLATINTLAPAPIHSLATCPNCLECCAYGTSRANVPIGVTQSRVQASRDIRALPAKIGAPGR